MKRGRSQAVQSCPKAGRGGVNEKGGVLHSKTGNPYYGNDLETYPP